MYRPDYHYFRSQTLQLCRTTPSVSNYQQVRCEITVCIFQLGALIELKDGLGLDDCTDIIVLLQRGATPVYPLLLYTYYCVCAMKSHLAKYTDCCAQSRLRKQAARQLYTLSYDVDGLLQVRGTAIFHLQVSQRARVEKEHKKKIFLSKILSVKPSCVIVRLLPASIILANYQVPPWHSTVAHLSDPVSTARRPRKGLLKEKIYFRIGDRLLRSSS